MKFKPRAIPRIKIELNRSIGDYIDGIYKEIIAEKFEIAASVQPYNGSHLMNNKDLQWIKSSIILFTSDKIKEGDTFKYQDKRFVIKHIDPYYLGKLSHFEVIAFEYSEDFNP